MRFRKTQHQHEKGDTIGNTLASPYPLDREIAASGGRPDASRLSMYFDGVFKGDYSLAIVNRHLADAIIKSGVRLSCFTADAGWQTDPLLNEMPAVRACMMSAPPHEAFDVHIRNTWPPATRNMIGSINAYVCFAWEESEFPANLVETFNRDLDLVMVASTFVKRALVESGVTIPIEVVGEGADHVLGTAPPLVPTWPHRSRFLHVSSGFSRKGVDCLIRAYRQSFSAADDVELVIKTFPNPNNEIPRLIAELNDAGKDAPPIHVIEASYSHSELLELFGTATALVAPSRGEGFGLPLAEAMAIDVPVITTNYSGQVDFCRPETCWLVDYTLSASKAHVSGAFSLWAEPDVAHLGRQMQAVMKGNSEVAERTALAKTFVEEHLTWAKTASRTLFAISKHRSKTLVSSAGSLETERTLTMDVVTSWGRDCGIATYASHLYGHTVLSQHIANIFAQKHGLASHEALDEPRVSRVWGDNYQAMQALAARLERGTADTIWIQHHPGHFSAPDMHLLGQSIRKSNYKTRAITFHSVAEAARGGSLDWCNDFEIAFVHSPHDAEVLSRAGHRNPVVVPHGCLPPAPTQRSLDKPHFDIGSFGFLTPHKNVDLLVRAFELAYRFTPDLRLHLFNCVQPNDHSRSAQAIVENLIRHHGLEHAVYRHYEFIPEDELLPHLARCDLFAFPYGQTTETATGAARIALSANKPILCSQSAVLRDLHPVSHVLKELSVECLAEALISLSQSDDLLSFYDYQRTYHLKQHSYDRAATRYLGSIMRTLETSREHSNAA